VQVRPGRDNITIWILPTVMIRPPSGLNPPPIPSNLTQNMHTAVGCQGATLENELRYLKLTLSSEIDVLVFDRKRESRVEERKVRFPFRIERCFADNN